MEKKPYSQSQKIRFALHDLWSALIAHGKLRAEDMPFEQFYNQETEEFHNQIRNKIDSINLDV